MEIIKRALNQAAQGAEISFKNLPGHHRQGGNNLASSSKDVDRRTADCPGSVSGSRHAPPSG